MQADLFFRAALDQVGFQIVQPYLITVLYITHVHKFNSHTYQYLLRKKD